VHGVRSLGSATLDLAYVAMGSFDIWWEGVSLPFLFLCGVDVK
jgi:fructose-1,6-bisphosphatase/inositol monophosphatase family enzyme